MGTFTEGEFLNQGKSIVVYKESRKLQVKSGIIPSRPNGSGFCSGVQYSADGTSLSGMFGEKDDPVLQLELKSDSADDFLDMGKDLMNADFGPRYVKYSDNPEEHGFGNGIIYVGEWSRETNQPHGRGIHLCGNIIAICYFKNGSGTGKSIFINVNEFEVSEYTVGADGEEHEKTIRYYADGTSV
jgi:hypothetical protein